MNDQLLELRADGALVILTFEVDETSKLTRRFIDELGQLVTAAPKKPLVYATPNSLAAVYRAVPSWYYALTVDGREVLGGLRISDIRSQFAGLIKFAVGDEFTAAADGAWLANRTPDAVPRWQLPVFNDTAAAQALTGLVEKWQADKRIVNFHGAATPSTWEPDYTVRPNTTPTRDQDPMVRLATKVQAAARRVVGLE